MQIQWANENITYGFIPSSRDELVKKIGPFFLIAQINPTIVGFICASIHVSEGLAVLPKGQEYLEIDDIYVKPEFRKKGIGSRLMDSIIQTAQHNNIKRFMVYSATKDLDKILNFYRGHGFNSWYVQLFK
jgi:ribosomal protein S18 acetylase RimI-like enzyme